MNKTQKIKKKGNEGITLIALVITIIVLIILAGITINLLMGENGILQRSKDAKVIHEKEDLKEQISLAITAKQLERNGSITPKEMEEVLGNYGTVTYNTDGTIKSVEITDTDYEILYSDIYTGDLTNEVYAQGQEVKIGNEYFYVLTANDTEQADTITLFAKYSLNKTAETSGTFSGHYMQKRTVWGEYDGIRFSTTKYFSGDNINLNEYTTSTTAPDATKDNNAILRARDYAVAIGGEDAQGRLLTYEEAVNIRDNGTDVMIEILWGSADAYEATIYWPTPIHTETQTGQIYWLGTGANNVAGRVYLVNGWDGNNNIRKITFSDNTENGCVRPVITVSKSIVEVVSE